MDEWKIPTGQWDPVGSEAFGNDLFDRRRIADTLTNYISRFQTGCVIGIDAPWGEGKTWFGRNWEAYLKEKDFKVIYLDAFKTDYFEDPFLALSAEIIALLKKEDLPSEKIKNSLLEIGKVLLPTVSRVLLSASMRLALGSDGSDAIKELKNELDQDSSKLIENVLEDRLKEYESEKGSLEDLRNQLSELALNDKKPIVFFIDELDRCKPTYAIKMLERIKHFFDIPGLIFILLINRQQLERSVAGVYGFENEGAAEYLEKFVHFFFISLKNGPLTLLTRRISIRFMGNSWLLNLGLLKDLLMSISVVS